MARTSSRPELAFALEDRNVIAVCPEELGGLETPRAACQISGGDGADVLDGNARVIDADGIDQTEAFLSGARAAMEPALAAGAREAILKERSPSCGVKHDLPRWRAGPRPGGVRRHARTPPHPPHRRGARGAAKKGESLTHVAALLRRLSSPYLLQCIFCRLSKAPDDGCKSFASDRAEVGMERFLN